MTIHLIRNAFGMLLVSPLMASFTFAEGRRPRLKSAVTGNNAFALDLYSVLKKEKGNLFLSPYSISSALAMTYAGARGDTASPSTAMHKLVPSSRWPVLRRRRLQTPKSASESPPTG